MTTTLPKLTDIEYAREIAWRAVGKCPSEDLCIDDQESLAQSYLELSDFVAELHRLAVDPDSRAADFYQDVTNRLHCAGIEQGWTGFAPFEEGDGPGSDLPYWAAEDGSSVWSCAEEAAANEEGWCLVAPSTDEEMGMRDALEIQVDVYQSIFDTDDQAWDHVLTKANEGSELHLRAVRAVDGSNDELGSCLHLYANDSDIPWPLDAAAETTETNAT